MEHLAKFHLDLCIPRYSNYPKVSYLGLNPGRGWNPDLEESYLLQYSECEAEKFTQGTLGIYICIEKKFLLILLQARDIENVPK